MKTTLLPTFALVLAAPTLVIALAPTFQGSGEFDPPNIFVSGTKALASEVNANFDAVAGQLASFDGRLDEIAPANVITVAGEGGQFSSISTALASITDASDTNRYLVRVAPGVYEETALSTVPGYVALQGSGASVTVLRTTRTSAAADTAATALVVSDGAVVSDLSIENLGATNYSVGVSTEMSGDSTVLRNVWVKVEGAGGSDHIAVHASDSNLCIDGCRLESSGAMIRNAAYSSVDTTGDFGTPLILNSSLNGIGVSSGIGMQLSQTAATVRSSHVRGGLHGIQALVNAQSKVHDSAIEASGLNPVYDQSGGASIFTAATHFKGGDTTGLGTLFKFVHCYKANFDPIVDGRGSAIE